MTIPSIVTYGGNAAQDTSWTITHGLTGSSGDMFLFYMVTNELDDIVEPDGYTMLVDNLHITTAANDDTTVHVGYKYLTGFDTEPATYTGNFAPETNRYDVKVIHITNAQDPALYPPTLNYTTGLDEPGWGMSSSYLEMTQKSLLCRMMAGDDGIPGAAPTDLNYNTLFIDDFDPPMMSFARISYDYNKVNAGTWFHSLFRDNGWYGTLAIPSDEIATELNVPTIINQIGAYDPAPSSDLWQIDNNLTLQSGDVLCLFLVHNNVAGGFSGHTGFEFLGNPSGWEEDSTHVQVGWRRITDPALEPLTYSGALETSGRSFRISLTQISGLADPALYEPYFTGNNVGVMTLGEMPAYGVPASTSGLAIMKFSSKNGETLTGLIGSEAYAVRSNDLSSHIFSTSSVGLTNSGTGSPEESWSYDGVPNDLGFSATVAFYGSTGEAAEATPAVGSGDPTVSGLLGLGSNVTGNLHGVVYYYSDTGNFAESGSLFRWQLDTGGGYSDIVGATSNTYFSSGSDLGGSLRVGVTPQNTVGQTGTEEFTSPRIMIDILASGYFTETPSGLGRHIGISDGQNTGTYDLYKNFYVYGDTTGTYLTRIKRYV